VLDAGVQVVQVDSDLHHCSRRSSIVPSDLAVMKFALLALFALLPLVVADVPIPYTNCGSPTDHIKISSATASVWSAAGTSTHARGTLHLTSSPPRPALVVRRLRVMRLSCEQGGACDRGLLVTEASDTVLMFSHSMSMLSCRPPIPGQSVTLTFIGELNEQLDGGTYILDVTFDGFPIVNQQGSLADLSNQTFPVPAGPLNMQQSLVVPSVIPAGSTILVNASALDTNGEELLCVGLEITVPSEEEMSEPKQVEVEGELPLDTEGSEESQLFNLVAEVAEATQKVNMKQVVDKLLHFVSGENSAIGER
jgi:hypothetical protein